MNNIFSNTFRKIFKFVHNTKKNEKQREPPEFQLQLIRHSSELQKPSIDQKESGSSQEPLITPKSSDSINSDEISREKIQNTQLL
jgi:hypothetical protein